MAKTDYLKNAQRLQELMQQAKIRNLTHLSQISGISERQLLRLQHGLLPKMPLEIALKLAEVLQIPLNKLLTLFLPESMLSGADEKNDEVSTVISLQKEYQRLQQQIQQQQTNLLAQFQRNSLQILEPWLLQWPTAVAAVQRDPLFQAVKLLPLVKPITELLKQWGVEAIATVGEEILYDPQWHQLMEGSARVGDLVKVRYVGYRQGDKLLYRAKVSLVRNGD